MNNRINRLLYFLFFIVFIGKVECQPVWYKVTEMKLPVAGGCAVYNESTTNPKLYVLGGYSDSLQSAVNWIQEYDILSNKWKIIGSMKSARSYFVAAKWNNKIVYFGGTPSLSSFSNKLESWDIDLQSEPEIIDSNDNFERSYATGYVSGDNFYIIGGTSKQSQIALPYILGYNLSTKKEFFTYELQSSVNPEQHMTIYYKDNIFIFGGYYNGVKSWINKFSISSNKLEQLSNSILEPRAGGAAIFNTRLNKGFLIGGQNEILFAIKSVEQIIFYPNLSFLLSSSSPINQERRNPMVVNYGNTIMLMGGFDENKKVVSSVEILIDPNDVEEVVEIPTEFSLSQNFPNPFNPTTNIKFGLPNEANVTLRIFNILGEEVATLVNKVMPAGFHTVSFDASGLTSGLYIYRIEAGSFVQVKKMMLMK